MPRCFQIVRSPLLYADDVVLLSCTKIGLKRLLYTFASYCNDNTLAINYNKSKILVFGRSKKFSSLQTHGHAIEQVQTSKYLGITFHHSLKWSFHLNRVCYPTRAASRVGPWGEFPSLLAGNELSRTG